jgi:hypothetical protein
MVSNLVLLKSVVGPQLFRQVGSRSGVIVLHADPGLTSLTRKYLQFFANVSSKGRMVVHISLENLSNALQSQEVTLFSFQICPFFSWHGLEDRIQIRIRNDRKVGPGSGSELNYSGSTTMSQMHV